MKKSFKDSAPVWALFSVPVIYFALAAATVYEPGMSLLRLLPAVTELGLGRVRSTVPPAGAVRGSWTESTGTGTRR